ncbi:unnamed protein product [Eruca vesicaria subsp. sativa]|uniref:SUEL-type lectin domain-containing protein n=1 Tax=Eruca vesicaria subsp. sativa TaxID=29727 RepID=A0ABC8JI90_ERUVS|nr:unnamed protein product [Eruca vesicaria subsp. sativa]
MDTSHFRRRCFILLIVLFYSSVFNLASNMDISDDARGRKINSTPKRFLGSTVDNGTDTGDGYILCAEADLELPMLDFNCYQTPKGVIKKINFVDYGNPSGKCEHYRHGNCGAKTAMNVVKKNCLGKGRCLLLVSDEMFGPSHCSKDIKLFVQVTCTKD